MILRNISVFIFQNYKSLQSSKIQKLPKIITCRTFSDSTYEFSKRNCTRLNDDHFDEFDFEQDGGVTEDYMEKLLADDENKLKKLKYTRLLINLSRSKGGEIPLQLTKKNWLRLLSYEEKNDQLRYLRNLHRKEKNRTLAKTVSQIEQNKYEKLKRAERERGPLQVTTNGPIIYRLRHNTLFYRILDPALDRFYNYRLLQAMMFAPTIVVDCGYEPTLPQREIDVLAMQIAKMWAHNRDHVSPFHVQFCNLNKDGRLVQRLEAILPHMNEPSYPFFHTSKSYHELYSGKNLVYLCPDARHDLTKFCADEIYIVGALSNTGVNLEHCRVKAKKEGLRMAKFPFKQYNVKLNYNQHSLELLIALAILNDLKETGDWNYAFRHVQDRQYRITDPRTKMYSPDHSIKGQQRLKIAYDMLLTKFR